MWVGYVNIRGDLYQLGLLYDIVVAEENVMMEGLGVKHFFRNAVDVQQFDGGVIPLRFTERQMDFFASTPWKFRSYNTAGICLDFITDSPFFRMSYRVNLKPGTTEKVYFDIYVDGHMIGFAGNEIVNKGLDEWTVSLPIEQGSPRRITIYFPVLARIIVQEMEVAEGAVWEPAEPCKENLLCLGDSITQGFSATHPSSSYAALLARFLDMNMINQAVAGYFFNPGTIDLELPYKPDLITVAYGTNDWAMCESYEQFKRQATEYIHKLSDGYAAVPIVVLSPIWRSDMNDTDKKTGAFTDIHRTLAQICESMPNVQFIDGFSLVPNHAHYFADGLHPTDEGFLHYALNLIKQIRCRKRHPTGVV